MTENIENQGFEEAAGRALWRRAAERFAEPVGAPATVGDADALLLAAHLDGRLDPAEQEAFEARLAAEPALLELFLEADQAVGATQTVSERQLARAAALVKGEALAPPRSRRFFGGQRETGGWFRLRAASLAATVAAVVVASAIGFEIGRFGYAVAAETYLDQGDSLAAQIDGGF